MFRSNDDETFTAIKKEELTFLPQYWDSISQGAKQLIGKMLDRNPETRFKADDILKDAWFEVTSTHSKQSATGSKKNMFKAPRSNDNTKIALENQSMLMETEKNELKSASVANKMADVSGGKYKKNYKASNVL